MSPTGSIVASRVETQAVVPTRARPLRVLRTYLWWSLTIALIAAASALMLMTQVWGWTPLAVTSGSMEPLIPTGAMIFVEEADPASVRVGDVISFDAPGKRGRVTHRVAKIERRKDQILFETKGDANNAIDDWRTQDQKQPATPGQGQTVSSYSRGVSYGESVARRYVFGVPYLGRATIWFGQRSLHKPMMLAPFGLLALWTLAWIWARPTRSQSRPLSVAVRAPEQEQLARVTSIAERRMQRAAAAPASEHDVGDRKAS